MSAKPGHLFENVDCKLITEKFDQIHKASSSIVQHLDEHANHCSKFFTQDEASNVQKPKQQKKKKRGKKQVKHEDDDLAFLDTIIETNKIDIVNYKNDPNTEDDEVKVDMVISWYLEKLEVVTTYEEKRV